MIDVNTKLLGLIGYPLKHSFSPNMHNYAYLKNNLNYAYIPLEIEEDKIKNVLNSLKALGFIGFNVTIPYKVKIMEYLDDIDELAHKIGSVNTVKIMNGKLKGYNTDGLGFIKSLENKDIKIKRSKVLVIGAGGASRAVSISLCSRGVEKLYITNRTYKKAEKLSKEINSKVRKCSSSFKFDEVGKILKEIDIIVNTTSVGMKPHINETPIKTDNIMKKTDIVDIVYNPSKTKLIKETEKKGCRVVNGIDMLVYQGSEAFKIWTELESPVDDMKISLEKFLI